MDLAKRIQAIQSEQPVRGLWVASPEPVRDAVILRSDRELNEQLEEWTRRFGNRKISICASKEEAIERAQIYEGGGFFEEYVPFELPGEDSIDSLIKPRCNKDQCGSLELSDEEFVDFQSQNYCCDGYRCERRLYDGWECNRYLWIVAIRKQYSFVDRLDTYHWLDEQLNGHGISKAFLCESREEAKWLAKAVNVD